MAIASSYLPFFEKWAKALAECLEASGKDEQLRLYLEFWGQYERPVSGDAYIIPNRATLDGMTPERLVEYLRLEQAMVGFAFTRLGVALPDEEE